MWIAVVRELDRSAGLSVQTRHAHRSIRGRRPTDSLARILAEPLKQSLGQAILVENVTVPAGPSALRAPREPRRTATP